MELYPFGDALFSTHHGKYSPRPASLGPIVLRSSPEDDQDSMVARLRWKFPLQCKEIKAPIENIYQWFDPYDTHRHGYAFLHSVLSTIAFQNSVRAGQLNSFAEKWKKANPGRFDAIKYYSVDMFIRDELWEFGHEFLADVAQILHASRYSTTPHYFRSEAPDVEAIRHAYPYHSQLKPVGDNHLHNFHPRSNSQSFRTKRAGPPAHSTSPPTDVFSEVPSGQTSNSNSTRPNYISVDPSGQLSVHGPRQIHSSARRGEFCNYPEYHNYTFPPPKPDQEVIFATPPAALQGGSSNQNKPLNDRLMPLHEASKTVELSSSVPNPPKIASDDARVLELQEIGRGPTAFFKATQSFTASRPPLRAPSQVAPLVESQVLSSSSFTQPVFHQDHLDYTQPVFHQNHLDYTQPVFHQERLDYTPTNDPAVVFIGNKSGNGTYCDYHLQHKNEMRFLPRNEQHRNENRRPSSKWPYTLTTDKSCSEDQPPANAHLVGTNHQSFHPQNGRNLQNSEYSQYHNTLEKQEASSWLDTPSHHPLPLSTHGAWPVETGRSGHYPARLYDDDERKVYVGNIPSGFTQDMIKGLFDPKVLVSAITNIKVKNPRGGLGFAFVTFVQASDAIDAIKKLDSTRPSSFGGRRLILSQAYSYRQHRAGDGLQDFHASAHKQRGNSDFSGSPGHIHFSRAKSSRSSPIKAPKNSARRKRYNEKTPSRKTAVFNEESGHDRKNSSQRVHSSTSATNLPTSKNMERHVEKDEEPTTYTNRKEISGPREGREIMADKLMFQPPPMDDHVGFPPLVASSAGAILSKTQRPPYFRIGVSTQSQGEAKNPTSKNEMLDDTPGITEMAQGLQGSEKVRGESIPTAQSVQSASSIQVTEPTSDVESNRSECYTIEARLSRDMIPKSQPLQAPTLTQSEGKISQQGIEDSCAAAEPAKDLEAHVPENAKNSIGPVMTTPGSILVESTLVEESKMTSVAIPSAVKPIQLNLDLAEPAAIQSPMQTEPTELGTPTMNITTLEAKTSPKTPGSDSGQTSLPHSNAHHNRRRSEMLSRTSSLSSPATPIVTHKKKLKVFTPLKESASQSIEAMVQEAQPGGSVSLKTVGTVGREMDHIASGKDKKPSPDLFNVSTPTLEQEEVTPINQRKGRTKHSSPSSTVPSSTVFHSTMPSTIPLSTVPPTTPQSLKPKQKNMAKSSKSKSKGRQISSDLLVDKTAASSSEEKSRIYQTLPEPETPYLVDNQHVKPKIEKKVHADSHTTSTDNQHPQSPRNRIGIDPVQKRGLPMAMQSSTWFSDFFSQHISNEPTSENSNETSPVITAKSFELTASHNDQSGSPATDLSKGASQASKRSPEDTGISRSSSNFGESKMKEVFDYLSNEITKSSDLPFRQLYSNLDSAISTTAVVASSSRHDSPSSSSTLSNDVVEGEVVELPVTPPNKIFPSSSSAASTPSTVVHMQTSNLASPKHHVVMSNRDSQASASSTPTRKGRGLRKGHNRGTSLNSSISSNAEITARNDRAPKVGAYSSTASPSGPRTPRTPCTPPRLDNLNPKAASPLSTPNSWAFPSYAAAAAKTPKGSPPLNAGDTILIASSERPVQKKAGKSDPWQVPKGEKAWGK